MKPTVFYGAPTGFAGMLASQALPPRAQTALRLVSSAGEAFPAEIGRRFTAHFGVDIIDGIGSTEMLHIFISNRPDAVCYGTTGWPVPGYEIELRDDDGRAPPEGEPGDLYIRGPSSAMMGLWFEPPLQHHLENKQGNPGAVISKSIKVDQKRRRGRPATGRDPMVSSRIPAEIIAQIDEWAASHDTTRSDAIQAPGRDRPGLEVEDRAVTRASSA